MAVGYRDLPRGRPTGAAPPVGLREHIVPRHLGGETRPGDDAIAARAAPVLATEVDVGMLGGPVLVEGDRRRSLGAAQPAVRDPDLEIRHGSVIREVQGILPGSIDAALLHVDRDGVSLPIAEIHAPAFCARSTV